MNWKHCILVLPIMWCTSAMSQDCTSISSAKIPGTYKQGMSGSVSGVSSSDLAKEKTVVASLLAMLRKNYQPEGIEVNYNGVYGFNAYANPFKAVNPYALSMMLMPLYCENGVVKRAHETSSSVRIHANSIDDGFNYKLHHEDDGTDTWMALNEFPEKHDDYYLLSRERIGGFGKTIRENKYIVTYNNQLPLVYLTRKQFFDKKKIIIVRSIQYTRQAMDAIDVNFDAASKRGYDNLKSILQAQLEAQEKVNQLAGGMTTEEQAMTAIVKNEEDAWMFSGFARDPGPNSMIFARPDPNYFKKGLPRYSPQFFTVVTLIEEAVPVYRATGEALVKAIDFPGLKGMLGK